MAFYLTLGFVVIVLGWLIVTYNGLIGLKNQVQNAWQQIDVQLKRRHDLIPNLVNAVKGAMQFERDTLEKVIGARSRAVSAKGAQEAAAAEGQLSQALSRLFALMENYPDLKSSQNVLQLQEELTSTENRIGFARQLYNDLVARYNIKQQVFPTNMMAAGMGFGPADYFRIEEAEKGSPRVDLSLN
ncbi:MAG: LemA family protein [Candidatus Methylomirabilis oxyfera]|nr:LemA family protein [Candidatus Methylomirabilis oxyfera]